MLIGEIVEYDGMLCLQTAPRVYYPLGGNSGIAADFVEAFGPAQRCDIGKQVHCVQSVLQMENDEQRKVRTS